jgi:hypothetical protein
MASIAGGGRTRRVGFQGPGTILVGISNKE